MTMNFNRNGGGGGTTNYNQLTNKPKINNVELSGNKTSSNLGLQDKLTFDAQPTAGSNNPVTSDGLATAMSSLSSGISYAHQRITELPEVAHSGNYTDLVDRPILEDDGETEGIVFGGQSIRGVSYNQSTDTYETNWELNPLLGINYDYIADKPTIARVGKTGNYSDLSNKPEINGYALQSGNNDPTDLGLQELLTFDSVPTQGSDNPVTSGGVYAAIQGAGTGLNYSTTEQVVGTWIDGKPLYQITKQWQIPAQVTGQWNNYSIGNLGSLEYMNISELAFDYSTSNYRFGNTVGLGTMEVASSFEKVGARLGYNTESGNAFVQLENVGTTSPLYQYGGTLTATIRYTKTTD